MVVHGLEISWVAFDNRFEAVPLSEEKLVFRCGACMVLFDEPVELPIE